MRKWFFDQVMDMSLEVTESLYTTLYLRPWLRILGAHIGPRSEIDEVRFQPDLFLRGRGMLSRRRRADRRPAGTRRMD